MKHPRILDSMVPRKSGGNVGWFASWKQDLKNDEWNWFKNLKENRDEAKFPNYPEGQRPTIVRLPISVAPASIH